MVKSYGVPYMGSKNKIAPWIIEHLPRAEVLVEPFAGGCAVTHCALEAGAFERFVCNDIVDAPQLFVDAIAGKYADEERWISREDFNMFKDADPYIRYCWSFGNRGETYLYSREIEPLKHALHLLIFAKTATDRALMWRNFVNEYLNVWRECERIECDVLRLCEECDVEPMRKPNGALDAKQTQTAIFRAKSADIREYMRDALAQSGKRACDVNKLLGTNRMAGHYFGACQWALPTAEAYAKMQTIIPQLTKPWAKLNEQLEKIKMCATLQSLQRLQSLQSLQRLQSLQKLKPLLSRITVSQSTYNNMDIPPNATIYCDPPYRGTADYNGSTFDFDAFDEWVNALPQMAVISEYTQPAGCVEVARIDKRCSLSAINNSKVSTERLFVQERFVDEYRERVGAGELVEGLF